MKRSIIVAFAALALSTSVFANTGMNGMKSDQPGKSGSTTMSTMTPDKMTQSSTLGELHHINQKEIEMARLVQKKAQSPELKEYANTLLQDHQQADKKLQDLAKAQNIKLSAYEPAGYEKMAKNDLEKMSGADFDRSFLEMAKMDHKQVLQELKATSDSIQNSQIQQFVQNELMPAIQKHQQIASTLKISGSEQAGEMGTDQSMDSSQPQDINQPSTSSDSQQEK